MACLYTTDAMNNSMNNSSSSQDFEWWKFRPTPHLRPARTTFVVIGILLNLIVIFASSFMVATNTQSRPSSIKPRRALRIRPYVHFYPILFAVANIVFLSYEFLIAPFWSKYDLHSITCRIRSSLEYILHSVLIYCVVALCCHVYSATRNRTLTITPVIKHRFLILLLIIVLSILNGVPIMIWGSKKMWYNLCYKWDNFTFFSKFYAVYFTSMVYFLPLLITTILYSIVVYHLYRSSSSGGVIKRKNSSKAEKRAIAKRRKLAYASIVLAISFFVSYFPTSFCHIVFEYNHELYLDLRLFREVAAVGLILHTCVVPIVWCITTDYRRYIKKYFTMRHCMSDMSTDSSTDPTIML